ncbi:uncharacterized protein LOC128985112 [Macrosteles quadrilineatus]|uniref:uncharacterized protein LOC128985112 n=1 Tax=Macrosteles quadrilineatus TaxID=74068 RepID=UPI0023E1D385|nr:uncharacterized protein LOC128985112 [Macrosteles quadrilineatus]
MKSLSYVYLCLIFILAQIPFFVESSKEVTNIEITTKSGIRDSLNANQWTKRKSMHHKEHKRGRHNRHSSAKRYFEKQLLVRNRTLALLGTGMEKFLPNAVDLLDINPQELPGESPFQKWHNHGKKNTELEVNNTKPNLPDEILKRNQLLDLEEDQSFSDVRGDQMIGYDYRYESAKVEDTEVLQLNLGRALKTLLRIFSISSNNKTETNPCKKWMGCKKQLKQVLMGQLPSCPCEYPSSIFYEDKVWDKRLGRYFRWKDASGERLDVYKPGADYCIRSLINQGSSSLAVQQCCYDRHRRLITRGSGAGTPNLISPDISPQLHHSVDILPWILCKGDFTIYNRARPPDNGLNCSVNPVAREFNRQIHLAKYF